MGTTKLILILLIREYPWVLQNLYLLQNYVHSGLNRSYRAYSYAELILVTDLCSFGTPVGVTELILILYSESYHITV